MAKHIEDRLVTFFREIGHAELLRRIPSLVKAYRELEALKAGLNDYAEKARERNAARRLEVAEMRRERLSMERANNGWLQRERKRAELV
jgi:hypothetical protein